VARNPPKMGGRSPFPAKLAPMAKMTYERPKLTKQTTRFSMRDIFFLEISIKPTMRRTRKKAFIM